MRSLRRKRRRKRRLEELFFEGEETSMKDVTRGIVKLIFILALIAGAAYIGKEAAPLIKLGLDLDGGVSITYQAAKDNPTPEEMGDSVYKLQLKAQDYSTEAEVYQEGGNKINIDIPGVSDANGILEELGKPGTLYFVEGNLTWPLLATDSEATSVINNDENIPDVTPNPSGSTSYYSGGVRVGETQAEDLVTGPGVVTDTAQETVAGQTSTENVETTVAPAVDNILGDNVHIEGADIIQNPDGSIQIGGTPQEGATVIQQGTTQEAVEASPSEIPNYDFS